MNVRTNHQAPLVGVVHLLPRIDEERDVLDPDLVVVMLAPVRWTQP